MKLTGDRRLASDMQQWLGLSAFAAGKGPAAARRPRSGESATVAMA